MSTHVNAAADYSSAFFEREQSLRHELARRCKDDRGIKLHRRQLAGASGPNGAESGARISLPLHRRAG